MPNDLNMTPKRAAVVLVYEWFMTGCNKPHHMTIEDMNAKLDGWGYNVTEKRREKIIEQVDKIIAPMINRLQDKIQDMGGTI